MDLFDTALKMRTDKTKDDVERVITQFYRQNLTPGIQSNLFMEANELFSRFERETTFLGIERKDWLTEQENIRKSDLMKADIRDIIKAYIDGFRVGDSFFPVSMRDNYQKALRKIESDMIDGMIFSMERNFDRECPRLGIVQIGRSGF